MRRRQLLFYTVFPSSFLFFRTTGEAQATRGHGSQGARGRAWRRWQALSLALAWVQWLRGSPVALPPPPPLQVFLQVRVLLGSLFFFCVWRDVSRRSLWRKVDGLAVCCVLLLYERVRWTHDTAGYGSVIVSLGFYFCLSAGGFTGALSFGCRHRRRSTLSVTATRPVVARGHPGHIPWFRKWKKALSSPDPLLAPSTVSHNRHSLELNRNPRYPELPTPRYHS